MKPSCVLLLSEHHALADSAEDYCRRLFSVEYCERRSRQKAAFPEALGNLLARKSVDYLFSFLSPVVIPRHALERVRRGGINFHPGPPEWPGVGCASMALYSGDDSFGVTAHRMEPRVDSGEIYDVRRFPILSQDDCEAVFRRAIEHCLIQFYAILPICARHEMPPPANLRWARRAITRREFEEWLVLPEDASRDEAEKRIRAARHPRLPGPFQWKKGEKVDLGRIG